MFLTIKYMEISAEQKEIYCAFRNLQVFTLASRCFALHGRR